MRIGSNLSVCHGVRLKMLNPYSLLDSAEDQRTQGRGQSRESEVRIHKYILAFRKGRQKQTRSNRLPEQCKKRPAFRKGHGVADG